MRKIVKCAAANDDDGDFDFGSCFEEKAPKKPRNNDSSTGTATTDQSKADEVLQNKKEKEFAWMDSDTEAEGAEEAPMADTEEEVTSARLDKVDSFGRMMMLSESLGKKAKQRALDVDELASAFRALARTKFFDGDLLEDLVACLLAFLDDDKTSALEVTDVIVCSKELNYYNKNAFSAICRKFKAKIASLSGAMRNTWLDAMTTLGHKSDIDFMQMLEMPPLQPSDPNFRNVRCFFFEKGTCELGTACTYAHSKSAPLSLQDNVKEDAWRSRSSKGKVLMTHDQKYVFKEKEQGQSLQGIRSQGSTAGGGVNGGQSSAMMQMMFQTMQSFVGDKGPWEKGGGMCGKGCLDVGTMDGKGMCKGGVCGKGTAMDGKGWKDGLKGGMVDFDGWGGDWDGW